METSTIQDTKTVTIVITGDNADNIISLLTRIADGLEKFGVIAEQPAPPPSPPEPPKETYGIRPDAMYPQWQVMEIFSCSDKTLRKWRRKHGLRAYQSRYGTQGSRIWYSGQDLIDFFREFAVALRIKTPKPIDKDVPKGQMCNPPKDLKQENARTRFEKSGCAHGAQPPDG